MRDIDRIGLPYRICVNVRITRYRINASIIPLPVDYTRIVGRKNSSYVIAFNLDYFDIATNEPAERKLKKFPLMYL